VELDLGQAILHIISSSSFVCEGQSGISLLKSGLLCAHRLFKGSVTSVDLSALAANACRQWEMWEM
jgi:hypothetical protein